MTFLTTDYKKLQSYSNEKHEIIYQKHGLRQM